MISKDSARGILLVALLSLGLPSRSVGQQGLDSRAAFERLKGLAGTWDVTERDNPATKEIATYAMTGRGSVLVEHLQSPTGTMGHMMTTYHLDNGRLVLTHFCGAGNQPRMRVTAIEDAGKRIAFEMYDITNLASPQAFHSTSVDVVFLNDDRVDLVYRGKAGDRESTQVFQLARKTRASAEGFYQRLRSLEGEWQGTFQWSGGRTNSGPMRATYSLTGGGSSLVENLFMSGSSPSMTTVYHVDGADLRMTHYCIARNQPRLKATRLDEATSVAEFDEVDVTGSDPQNRAHVQKLTLRLVGDDELRLAFTFGGGDSDKKEVEDIVLKRMRTLQPGPSYLPKN